MGEPYYRKKEDKIVIEQKLHGKTKYIKTLPPAKGYEKTWRLEFMKGKASQTPKAEHIKVPDKGAQPILSEPSRDDIEETLKELGL